MLQDYGINITIEWLKKTSARKFMSLLSGFTKNTAMGNYYLEKYNEKKKSKPTDGKRKKITFDPKSKNSWDMFRGISKNIGGK